MSQEDDRTAAMPPNGGRTAAEGDLSMWILAAARSQWPLVLATVVLCCVLAGAHAKLTTPVYEVRTELLVGSRSSGGAVPSSIMALLPTSPARTEVNTDAYLMRSWDARCVACEILTSHGAELEAIRIGADPQGALEGLREALEQAPINAKPYLELLAAATEPTDENARQYQTLNVLNSLRVTPVRDSRVLSASARSSDPALAADVVNATSAAFMVVKGATLSGGYEDSLQELRRRREAARREMQTAADVLTEVRSKNLPAPDRVGSLEEAKSAQDQLRVLRTQLISAESGIEAGRAAIAKLRQQAAGGGSAAVTSKTESVNPTVTQLQRTLADLYAQRSLLLTTYVADSEAIKAIDVQIERVKERIDEEVALTVASQVTTPDPVLQAARTQLQTKEAELRGLEQSTEPLRTAIANLRTKLANLPGDENTLAMLQSERELAAGRYAAASQAVDQLEAGHALASVDAEVITPARVEPGLSPVSPRVAVELAWGFILGCLLGAGLAVLRVRARKSRRLVEA